MASESDGAPEGVGGRPPEISRNDVYIALYDPVKQQNVLNKLALTHICLDPTSTSVSASLFFPHRNQNSHSVKNY